MMLQNLDNSTSADRRCIAINALNAMFLHYRGQCLDAEGQKLIDALFVPDADGTGLLTGISELSLSLRSGRPASIRVLSEVLQRRPLDAGLAVTGQQWGSEMMRRIAEYASRDYAAPLFNEIYEMLYLQHRAEPAPVFRFGIGAEFGEGSPVLKLYFDLHATAEERRLRSLENIAVLLDEVSSLASWKRACPGVNVDKGRVIGVDFGAGNSVRAKFYWTARHLSWDDIISAAREISGERHLDTLDRLRRHVCGAANALSAVLVSMCAANGEHSMKLDICIARLFKNDARTYSAIERFLGPTVDRLMPFELVSGGLPPHQTQCVYQYLGVELRSSGDSVVNLYYRPVGLDTEHLNAVLRPRAYP